MRLTLKHQIILAPAVVLLLMALLLGFLQFTYWDLSVKRREARELRTLFIALAEADLAAQRMYGLATAMNRETVVDAHILAQTQELYQHLTEPVERIIAIMDLPKGTRRELREAVAALDPTAGIRPERFLDVLADLRPQLATLSELTQRQRDRVRDVHAEDIDALVDRTAFVSIVSLGSAILIGIFLSLFFARRILTRIHELSKSAGRIAGGDLSPPPPPESVRDELDALSLSINRMTDQLIRVVGAEKLLEGAEEERRRMAMDLHDQALSDLSSILRAVQELREFDACREPVGRIEEDLQRAIGNLREIMDNLHPQTLEILGLGPALESHLERHFARGDLPEYHLYVSSDLEEMPLTELEKLTLYRIALEALHNVIKHAEATRYEVSLSRQGGQLLLAVEDNGRGFDFTGAGRPGGRGLGNIRQRAAAIGAEATWKPSRFSSGTRFELVLPLNRTEPQPL